MLDGLNLEPFIDAIAERVATRVGACLSGADIGAGIKPRLLSVAEAGRYLGRSRYSVQHLIQKGVLPPVKIDNRTFLDIEDLDRLIDESKLSV